MEHGGRLGVKVYGDCSPYQPPIACNQVSLRQGTRMILRRVGEHAKAQNWIAAALDFFIVVIGVFIGIEVANWNQTRQDRQEERRYYGQLLVDLRAGPRDAGDGAKARRLARRVPRSW